MTDLHPDRIRDFLDGRWGWARRDAREQLRDPRFAPAYDLHGEDYHARVTEQIRALAATSAQSSAFPSATEAVATSVRS